MRVHVFISGIVQGVFYRFYTKKRADKLGLSGWVRNLDDGRVEAVFEGSQKKVNKMVDWCWKGPTNAKVEKVEEVEKVESERLTGFEIRRN